MTEQSPLTEQRPRRAHLIAGGFPPGAPAGHDHDHARLTLLGLLADQAIQASTGNDYTDIATWLPVSRLLITYVAGPYPDAARCDTMRAWLEAGGHWLALHGTSGGRAERVEGVAQRRTIKMPHHALLGGFFLTHPPIRPIRVDVADPTHPLTQGLGGSFTVEDEPYFVELQDPGATRVLLTAEYGPDAVAPHIPALYGADTSLLPDGRTRVLAYTRPIGAGAVTYCALGHCHGVTSRPARATETGNGTFREPWGNPGFLTFLRNGIAWGTRDGET